MSAERDILAEFEADKKRPRYPDVVVAMGMVVEDATTKFCGDVVAITAEAVTLRDRKGATRLFRYKPGGFLVHGKPVTLVRGAPTSATTNPRVTNSGSIASPGGQRATTAKASRIWVEGRHDAELLEHVLSLIHI